MKAKKVFFSLAAIFIVGMSNPTGVAASTPSYLGPTTWSLYFTENTGDPSLIGTTLNLTGGITKMGDNFYSFQGSMMFVDTLMVLSGGGVLKDGKLILSVNASMASDQGGCSSGVFHFILNQSDLHGSFTEIFHAYVIAAPPIIFQGYAAGTLTCTGPMISLHQAPVGALNLLLE